MSEPKQVRLTISTDLYYTADFLRELAVAIEDSGSDRTEFETDYGVAEIEWPDEDDEEDNRAYDKNGVEIHTGDKVIWTDPDDGHQAEYEVYDKYPTQDMVKLWSEYGECEALPQECEVIK